MSIRPIEPQPDLDAAALRASGPLDATSRKSSGGIGHLLRANVRSHARRYVATGLAVAISMAFVVIALAVGANLSDTMQRAVRDQYQGAAVVVTLDWGKAPTNPDGSYAEANLSNAIPQLEAVDGVGAVGQTTWSWLELRSDKRSGGAISLVNPDPLGNPAINEGSLPSGADQIALSASMAKSLDVSVGDTVSVKADGTEATKDMTVSGTWPNSFTSFRSILMTPDAAHTLFGEFSPETLQVAGKSAVLSDADQDALAAAISAQLADQPITVTPAHQIIADTLAESQMNNTTSTAALLVFPVIAVAVAAIVVSTTFQIVLQQRRRELALLRTLGASAGQVRGLIRREALIVGAVSALVGVVLGLLLSATGLALLGQSDSFIDGLTSQKPLQLAAVWVLGTLLTFVIGMRPAAGVAKISPIEALAPIDETDARARKSHRIRAAFGIVVAALGGAGMAMGLRMDDDAAGFGIALLSGIVCLVGALLMTSVFLPKLTYAMAMPFRGVVGTMAKGNTLRNPDRTASTGTAIVVGVSLITMMLVAAGSMRATLFTEVDHARPFDLVATSESGALGTDMAGRIRAVNGVDATQDIYWSTGIQQDTHTITLGGDTASAEAQYWTVVGEPDLNPVAHSEVSVLGDDQVRMSIEKAAYNGGLDTSSGTLEMCAAAGECRTLTIVDDENAAFGQLMVSAHTLEELAPDRTLNEIYIRLTDEADVNQVQTDILSIDMDLNVGGAAAERAMYTQMINIMLAVVIGLLAVSVLVALVGVANTLSLSVAERTRENGLLRALGFTKRQMQRMLAAESLYIGLSASVVGVGLGILFGWVGVNAIPMDVKQVILIVPWLQIVGVFAVAIAAALLASWWPGRRAARTSPVEALAAE